MQIKEIGFIKQIGEQTAIELIDEYIEGLLNIKGYSHLEILWWANLTDTKENRKKLVLKDLLKEGPKELGVFSTRSPIRPNPVMISTIKVERIDFDSGIIYTKNIDAIPGTPLLDIKPYHSMRRVKNSMQPSWCVDWPKWHEDVGSFNWEEKINFNSNQ